MGWITAAQAAAMTEEERLDFLTRTVLGEAVGEGYTGMVVVGQVIANRARDGRFPADPVAVAGQSWQFTTHADTSDGNQARVKKDYPPTSKEYMIARAAVMASVINKTAPDITGGAVNYHTVSMGWPASWPTSIKKFGSIDIGNHRVYPTHLVPPGDIPGALAKLEFDSVAVGSMVSVRSQGLAPIRPAKLSDALTLQRSLNNVAQRKANAPATIRRNRSLAFMNTIDPFDVGRPANSNPIINRPVPAMKQSMQQQVRATGTLMSTARTFAFDRAAAQAGPVVSSVALNIKPPAVVAAPWGVRQTVAAQVAAAAADNGRGQLIMTGNPNIAGSVVDWLYPQIAEGEGEANQTGKGPRAKPMPGQTTIERNPPKLGQSNIERNPPKKGAPPQSQIERQDKPLVVVAPSGKVNVIPQSIIERNPPSTVKPVKTSAITAASQQTAADLQAMRNANQNAKPVVPGPKAAPKVQDRMPVTPPIVIVQAPAKPTVKLPPIAPPRSDPIGTMPDFKQLAMPPASPLVPLPVVRPTTRPVTANSPVPASVEDRVTARNKANNVISISKGAPIPASVEDRVTARNTAKVAPVPVSPALRPAGPKPTTRTVPTTRVTTTAPVPASVEDRVTARNTSPTIVAPGGMSKSGSSGGASKGGTNPVTKKSSGSPSSSSSGSSGNQAPTFVRASTGQTLSPVVVSSFNAATNTFEKKTVYR